MALTEQEIPTDPALLEVAARRLMKRGVLTPTGCIEYEGATVTGYGSIQIWGRSRLVHRVAWTVFRSPIPDGKFVLHRCDNPPCFNPNHLYIGDQSDNTRDRHTRKPESTARGEQLSHLTPDDVHLMRRLHARGDYTYRRIQKEHFPSLNERSISLIVQRKRWSHI